MKPSNSPTPLKAFFNKHGSLERVCGNTPFALLDESSVWLVERGLVEIFSVAIHGDQVDGARHHFLTVSEGELFFGTGASMERSMLAVAAANTRLLRVPLADYKTALSRDPQLLNSTAPALDRWLQNLSFGLSKNAVLPCDMQVTAGKEQKLAKGQTMRSKSHLLWLRPTKGKFLLSTAETVDISAQNAWFPLSNHSRIEVFEDLEFSAMETEPLLEASPQAYGMA